MGPWWENINIAGVYTSSYSENCNRNKKQMYENIFDKFYSNEFYENKTILDIGCNAGGNIIELSKKNPKKILGIDFSKHYMKQAQFTTNILKIKCDLKLFNICRKEEELTSMLGKYDIIFCLGVIYHLSKNDAMNLLKYLKNNGKNIIMSSQDFNIQLEKHVDKHVDWHVNKENIRNMLIEAGFSGLNVLYDEKTAEFKNFEKTNTFYFEALH